MVAAAIVGGAVVGGIASSSAAGDAADAQVQASQNSSAATLQATREQIAANRAIYDQNRADLAPWRDSGVNALHQMDAGLVPGGDFNRNFTMSDFTADPGYQFRMDQGSKALERSAAARGELLSGGTGMALQRYGQDYASGEFSNAYNRFNNDRTQRFNRLASVAGLGQTSAAQVANQGSSLAGTNSNLMGGAIQTVGNNITGAGNAAAAGIIGQGNAISGAANGVGNYFMMRQFLGGGGGGMSSGGVPPNPYYGGGFGYGSSGMDYSIYG